MNAEYVKGAAIILAAFLAFVFASRKQFYERQGSADTYLKYVGSGMSGCLWIIVKILSIMFFLYGLATLLHEYDKH